MQILIDLDEVYYEGIVKDRVLDTSIPEIFDSIKKGVLLPKGHGRLIDADSLILLLGKDHGTVKLIKEEPTIIKADRSIDK